MDAVAPKLAEHRDRLKWNARYAAGRVPSFAAHPLAAAVLAESALAESALAETALAETALADTALAADQPGPVLELACGPSGSALLAASAGRLVTAVDVSDTALRLLAAEAARRGLAGRITLVQADLTTWQPDRDDYVAVLCFGYWDRAVFGRAASAVAAGGLLAWEALTAQARLVRPSLPAAWCLGPGEPETLLPPGFEALELGPELALAGPDDPGTRRRLLARKRTNMP